MYFKSVIRKNPASAQYEGYYRIVESYRNETDRVCHRTLLNVGFIDFDVEKLNTIKDLLNDKVKGVKDLFESADKESIRLADLYWNELVLKGKVDVSEAGISKKERMVDMETIRNKDVREIGAEWMCHQALEQLKIRDFLARAGWKQECIDLAITQIISRAIFPHSENKTAKWIQDNSGVCEITGYPIEKMTKDKLYDSALKLYELKDGLEMHLSKRTNELFDLRDKIILYDLTNTYFEGRKANSSYAKFGRSKERRNDAKIVVLALVVNVEGFIKFSSIFEGNTTDSESLPLIIEKVRKNTSTQGKAIVVLDAGIATESNLELIKAKGYDYVCVSRSKIKDYQIDSKGDATRIKTKTEEEITLQKVKSKGITDYVLKVTSPGKAQKEGSMKNQFEERFKVEIEKIRISLSKKRGTKKVDKVNRRIGRAIEKYPSIAKHYEVEIRSEEGVVTEVVLNKKQSYDLNEQTLGVYFLRTSLNTEEEKTVWEIYNTIREIESSFRCLKTDLDLRPIYHKNDESALAHLHLGLLAYWVVNTIRYQLKSKGTNDNWKELLRIMSTQKLVTTTGKNTFETEIFVRRCSEPTARVKQIYQALEYKHFPFVKRKVVVHKPELKNKTILAVGDFEDT